MISSCRLNFFLRLICPLAVCLIVLLSFTSPAPAENGVTADTILIGQSCALSGPAEALGKELKAGAEAFFRRLNSQGGVNGRKIRLLSRDDGYEPLRCIQNTRQLILQDRVFILFGYVGTPTAKAAVNLIDKSGIPLVGPFTGAGFLRDTLQGKRNIFNIRGSYDQETRALVKHFASQGLTRFGVMFQDDSYGRAGLSGVCKALTELGLPQPVKGSYERNTLAVKSALVKLKRSKPQAIILVGAYKPCALFMKLAAQVGLKCPMANISFVGTSALLRELDGAGQGSLISQVVPSPLDESIPLVRQCGADLGRKPTYGELEGWLDALILTEGLRRAGSDLTRSGLVAALEQLSGFDAGGVNISFGSSDHQGMDKVFLTTISQGQAITLVEGSPVPNVQPAPIEEPPNPEPEIPLFQEEAGQ